MLQYGWILKASSVINQSQKDKYCMSPLIWGTYGSQIHRDRKSGCCQGKGRGEMGCCYLMGTDLQFYKMKRILEMDGDGDHTTVWMYLVSLTCTLAFPHSSVGKESACNAGDPSWIPGSEDPLEKEILLAWRIPWTEEPGGLQSRGSQEFNTA